MAFRQKLVALAVQLEVLAFHNEGHHLTRVSWSCKNHGHGFDRKVHVVHQEFQSEVRRGIAVLK